MGADVGSCPSAGVSHRAVHLSSGTYRMQGLNLAHGASIYGAGQETTVLEGTVLGLRTGRHLSDVTVTQGTWSGISLQGEAPEIRNCMIRGNRAISYGGGIRCFGTGSPKIANCTIIRNEGPGAGGVYCYRGNAAVITNSTISQNFGLGVPGRMTGSGVHSCCESSVEMVNCIVWGNYGASLGLEDGGTIDARYSCIETSEVWPGVGNINADPLICGWTGEAEVYVDASAPEGGDGSAGSPFSNLASAFAQTRVDLFEDSPCIGTGQDGVTMGAESDTCQTLVTQSRVIHLSPGTYPVLALDLSGGVSILGSGEDQTIIEGTLRNLQTSAALSDLTITRGTSAGILITNAESPEIRNCTIHNNHADLGAGGILCLDGSSPTITNCTIRDNSGINGGGLSCIRRSSPRLDNCTISDNSVTSRGGGVYCEDNCSPVLSSCTVRRNLASVYGGGIFLYTDCSPTLTNCDISENQARIDIGGIGGFGASPTVTDCTIRWNVAKDHLNNSSTEGGGVFFSGLDANPVLTNCVIVGNVASSGGGVYCGSGVSLTMVDCVISRNAADDGRMPCKWCRGGGLDCFWGSIVELVNCRIEENWSRGSGGGIYNDDGLLTLRGCTVRGNASAEEGGGLYFYERDDSQVEACYIVGCYAQGQGGGVYCKGASPGFVNCIVTGNWSGADCGGVRCSDYDFGREIEPSSPTFLNCTFYENRSQAEEGKETTCCDPDSVPKFSNCILWNNGSGLMCGDIQEDNCLIHADPQFFRPGVFDFSRWTSIDVGGVTRRMPSFIVEEPDLSLRPTSPAIDAGIWEGAPSEDITGTSRLCGHAVDIGAYEWCEGSAEFLRGDSNRDGTMNLADAVYILQNLFIHGPDILCPDAADSNDDESVDLADAVYILQNIFIMGPAIPEPGPERCGIDPTGHPQGGPDLPPCDYCSEACQDPPVACPQPAV